MLFIKNLFIFVRNNYKNFTDQHHYIIKQEIEYITISVHLDYKPLVTVFALGPETPRGLRAFPESHCLPSAGPTSGSGELSEFQ